MSMEQIEGSVWFHKKELIKINENELYKNNFDCKK